MNNPLSSGQAHQLDECAFLVSHHISSPEQKKQLTDLLAQVEKPGTEIERWNRLNRAQQAIAILLPEFVITGQFSNWMQQARLLKVPSLERHEAAGKDLISQAGKPLTEKQGALLDLIQATQLAYRQLRSARELRKTAAWSLVLKGLVLSLLAGTFAILAATTPWWDPSPGILDKGSLGPLSMVFTFCLVASFGLLGAFFSRLLTFQSRMGALTLSEFLATYQNNAMWVRLVFGGIGAVVFYLIVRANILGGTALPDFSKIRELAPKGDLPKDATAITIHTEFAKLMIWSFIAGFSERLVSSSLDNIEARASKPSESDGEKPSNKKADTP